MIPILCFVVAVTDGDTFRCSDGRRIRLAGVDAPELVGHCRRGRRCTPGDPIASRSALRGLIGGKMVVCKPLGRSYSRILATCRYRGIDVACIQLMRGHVVKRYSESWRVCR